MQLTNKAIQRIIVSLMVMFIFLFLAIQVIMYNLKIETPEVAQLDGSNQEVSISINQPWLPAWLFSVQTIPTSYAQIKVEEGKFVIAPQIEWDFDRTYLVTIKFLWKRIGSFEIHGPHQSTSTDVLESNKQSVEDNYPLANQLPYEDDAVYITYDDKRTLLVKVKKPLTDVEGYVRDLAIKMNWDLSGHKIVTE